jgi:UDP-3-O-[3-hydroxymyristoyl] N-acetylglucosamine deacetylase
MTDKGLVLIVDDEPGILETLAGVLSDQGFRTLQTGSGEEAVTLYRERDPDVVFLDIWLPDRDGLETLQAIREHDPAAAVVMMSGHGTTSTAVKALKMGALDYLEKPLSYGQAVEAVNGGLRFRKAVADDGSLLTPVDQATLGLDTDRRLEPPPRFALVAEGSEPQRTIGHSTVLYGLGLHSGRRTGMSLQPLPPDHGIHFVTLPTNTRIPAHVAAVGETTYATTLEGDDEATISTVEHLLSALHAAGVTNLLVKVHGEIPVLDGSALEFCRTLEEVGLEDQPARRREVVIDRSYEVTGDGGKSLRVEPYDGFAVSYLLRYPPPVGEQSYEYELTDFATYKQEIAPARTFGFLKDVKMMNELGLGSGGRIDNCILVGDDEVINTELRFADEFVRHKILDIIGDLYLLGYPMRGKVTAKLSGHRFNIDLLRRIVAETA